MLRAAEWVMGAVKITYEYKLMLMFVDRHYHADSFVARPAWYRVFDQPQSSKLIWDGGWMYCISYATN
jgi:hypothetical protein